MPPRTETTIVVMGVSGAGKSTVAAALAQHLSRPYLDADDLHPPANRAMLPDQLATLEPLGVDEHGTRVSGGSSVDDVVEAIIAAAPPELGSKLDP